MQKLLSRSPSPSFLFYHHPKPPTLHLNSPWQMPLPPPASFVVSGRGPGPAPSSSSSSSPFAASVSEEVSCHVSSRAFGAVVTRGAVCSSCRICRCSLRMGKGSGDWVAFRDERLVRGVTPVWVHTGSGAAEVVEAGGEGVIAKEERGRVLRRQNEGQPKLDLLAIPGVGPRNLRKLVDNGIAGVAELKQLYRDKVNCLYRS